MIAGGSISGIGKGVCTASLGKILQHYGYSVTAIKIDPYINLDAGTMRPTEHGECWVTHDGGETDQDLGTYERFLNIDIPFKNSITTGQIYQTVIEQERAGKYHGKTVQFIPHIIDEIKRRIKAAAEGSEIVLIEVGGTVGDYENIPFFFAMKSLERDGNDVAYALVSYLPVPSHLGEMKTKPTQQAIKMLSETGIFPDLVFCRGYAPLDELRKQKIETYANMPVGSVIAAPDTDCIYAVPLELEPEELAKKILQRLKLPLPAAKSWEEWKTLIQSIRSPQQRIKVAIVAKYCNSGDYSLVDSYLSVKEALTHAGAQLNIGIDIDWLSATELEDEKNVAKLQAYAGIIVPGGFGAFGVEGKINAIHFARTTKKPFLGLCYGLQLAVVEYARNVCGWDAHTTEVAQTTYPVVDILPMQQQLLNEKKIGGTMRLGEYASELLNGSQVLKLYQETNRVQQDQQRLARIEPKRVGKTKGIVILEKHRHRYEVRPQFVEQLEQAGLTFSGRHIREDDIPLMEFIELKNHPFFLATQAHPELKSRLGNPAPLFYGFIKACANNKETTLS